MTGRPLSLALYGAAMSAFEPFAPFLLKRRAARGKEDAARLGERLGQASIERPAGPLVWLHGVSVGESLSLLPLIDRIRDERLGTAILVTSGTVTSASLLAKRLPAGVIHQYAPVDGPRAAARFLDHWRPDLAIFAESELWPNLILGARAGGTKLALISARITDHTAAAWAKRRKTAAVLLSAFDLILPQDEASSARLTGLGAKAGPLLNLKYVADPLPADAAELGRLRITAAGRKTVFAASTHPGEEALLAQAIAPGPLLIIAPRHPERGEAVAAELAALGRQVARRSVGEPLANNTDVYLADTLGELGLFFRLADLAVMGGSLVPGIGGHNPLEPARLGTGAVSGPFIHNFADVYRALKDAGGVAIVAPDNLAAVAGLLSRPQEIKAMAAAAQAHAAGLNAQFDAGWALMRELLP